MTRARIWGATVFVDYASHWVKVHLMRDAMGDTTLESNNSFEKDCMTQNVVPKHYHADNERFAENSFKKDCVRKMQNLTFCDIGAHYQNGLSERIIKDLTLSSQTLVINAQRLRTEYNTTMFWPFALVAAADRMNNLHVDMHGQTPEMNLSTNIGSSTRLSHFHMFVCPVYILDARLQSVGGIGLPIWDPQICLEIYLGHSPSHA